MTSVTNELMYETLKKMQGDLGDIKRELREVKTEMIALRTIMGELIKTDARRDADLLGLHIRVERIEARLRLTDT